MEELQQGRVVEVGIVPAGSEMLNDQLLGDTVIYVDDTADFSDEGGQLTILDVVYSYVGIDDELSTVTLATGLVADVPMDTIALLYPASSDKFALVELDETEDAIQARVPHWMADRFQDGVRDEENRESVLVGLEDDEWILSDVMGKEPEIAGEYITDLPPSPPPEVVAPGASPTPTAYGSVGVIRVTWEPLPSPSPYNVQVHVSLDPAFVPVLDDPTTLAGTVSGTGFSIIRMPNGDPLEYEYVVDDTVDPPVMAPLMYYIRLIAVNEVGSAPPSEVAEGSMVKINSPDIAVDAVWAGTVSASHLTSGDLDTDIAVVRGSLTATGANGASVGLSGDGFHVIGATPPGEESGPTLVQFPTNGDPNIIAGTLIATTLTVTGDEDTGQGATFRRSNALELGSSLTLQNSIAAPNAAPILTEDWRSDSVTGLSRPNGNKPRMRGGCLGSDGFLYLIGVGEHQQYTQWPREGTLQTFRYVEANLMKVNASTYDVVDGQVLQAGSGQNITNLVDVCQAPDGTLWTLEWDPARYDGAIVRYTSSGVPLNETPLILGADSGDIVKGICTDGMYVYVAGVLDDTLRITRYTLSRSGKTVYTSSEIFSTEAVPGQNRIGVEAYWPEQTNLAYGMTVGTFDFGDGIQRFVLGATGVDECRVFTLSGSTVIERDEDNWLPASGEMSTILWDGTSFRSIADSGAISGGLTLYEYTHQFWDTESSKWWAAYTYYEEANRTRAVNTTSGSTTVTSASNSFLASDVGVQITGPGIPAGARVTAYTSPTQVTISAAATATASNVAATLSAETVESPVTSFTHNKRARWGVTVQRSPVGEVRVYLGRGDTNPGRAGRYRQDPEIDTSVAVNTVRDTAVFSGVNAPAATSFPAGTPASIRSEATDARSVTATSTAGSTTLTASSGTFLPFYAGRPITGAVPSGTTIVSVDSAGQSVVLSQPASSSGSSTFSIVEPMLDLRGSGFFRVSELIGYKTILTATQDATVNAGNEPPLRIGNILGRHLRIDGDEIVAMDGPGTSGVLHLANNPAQAIRIGYGGAINRISGVNFGFENGTTFVGGKINVQHGLGQVPKTFIGISDNGHNEQVISPITLDITDSIVPCYVRNGHGGALLGDTVVGFFWIAIS